MSLFIAFLINLGIILYGEQPNFNDSEIQQKYTEWVGEEEEG